MQIISHRVNTIDELKSTPLNYGVEIDLRDSGDKLILQHDPFSKGEDFEEFLKYYQHRTIILNIKSERIEEKVLDILRSYQVCDYFFLDSSFPMIYLLSSKGESNVAVRFSEFEKVDTVLALKNKINWVWIDCFTTLPINTENYRLLKDAGFKLCLVSPELQGRPEDITTYKKYLGDNDILIDAICTKRKHAKTWAHE